MKFFFTVILSFFALAAFCTKKPAHLRISSGSDAKVTLHYTSTFKKNTPAVFVVSNTAGKMFSTQSAALSCGENTVSLCDALDLPEGTYTVTMRMKNKTCSSQFIIWK